MTQPPPLQRQRSRRLETSTPASSVGSALLDLKPEISPRLLAGLPIRKVSSRGTVNPRLLTLSEDLFTLFVSHHRVGRSESLRDRAKYRGYKAYARVAGAVTGQPVQANHDLRVIDVADILFVQSGFIGSRKLEAAAHNCADGEFELDPREAISIFYNNGNTMDFLVEDGPARRAVLDAIRIVREAYHASKTRLGREERLLRYAWYDTDFNKTGTMEQDEFLQLLGRINIYLKREEAIKLFKTFVAPKLHKKGGRLSGPRDKSITFDECLHILHRINSDLNEGKETSNVLFDSIFGEEKWIATAEEFLTKFLRRTQKEEDATLEDVRTLFSRLNGVELEGSTRRVREDGGPDGAAIDRAVWKEYLMSRANDAYDPEKRRFDPSTLAWPLTHYWINSSHNTYLTGDQLKSLSSVEMYVVAMHRGCRCLEVDCWDDDDSGEPIVTHGYTLTSNIPFRSVVTCVKGYVDAHPDTLPIILSLENHCTHPFQEIMAAVLNDTLGDRLYKFPESADSPLPSPLDLVGKVVIKGKRPPEKDDDDDALAESESMEKEPLPESPSFQSEESAKSTSSKRETLRAMLRWSEKGKEAESLPRIVPALASLTLFNGVTYEDFGTSLGLSPTDMHSFSGSELQRLHRDPANVRHWKEYNVSHMSRIYPAGKRIDSSNFNPVVAWSSGCQLVALNFQSDDSPMTINDGLFLQNGGCGYVHKPPSVFPTDRQSVSGGRTLRIKVLSGSCLPKPYGESAGEIIDPYVVLRLHDVEKSEKMRISISTQPDSMRSNDNDELETKEWRTSSVRDNGFCPQWKDEEFTFSVNSDVSMLEIVVKDHNRGFIDEVMCKTAVPVSCLRQGLRSVQFYDQCSSQHGPFGMARILLDVDINHRASQGDCCGE